MATAIPLAVAPPLLVANWLLLVALLGAIGIVAFRHPSLASRLQLHDEPRATDLPVAGAAYIQEHRLPRPIFHYQPWGGYLIARFFPERIAFVDGRVDLYPATTLRDYVTIIAGRTGWRETLDRYGIQTVLVPHAVVLNELLEHDPSWRLVFVGAVERVYVRQSVAPTGSPISSSAAPTDHVVAAQVSVSAP